MIKEVKEAAPSTELFLALINDKIIQGAYYKALKDANELIQYETELLKKGTQKIDEHAE